MTLHDTDWIARASQFRPRIRDFVNGRWNDQRGETLIEKHSPRDGTLLYAVGTGHLDDVNDAVIAARQAFQDGRWSGLAMQQRQAALRAFAALIEAHRDELALLESLDVGKPIADAWNVDVPIAAATILFSAEAADKAYAPVYSADQHSLSYQLRRPLGVVAAIVGWNFPLALAAQKIGPVLVSGNSLVLKPSELTSLSAARVAELAVEAGIPEGVFNVIHGGAEIGAALACHMDVDAISFTGSTATGKKLLVASGESNMKRLVLECGGKAPNIVFDDCPDLEAVADAILARAFWNQGQVCTASSRLLVQENVKDELIGLVRQKIEAFEIGDPLLPSTRFGALVGSAHKAKVLRYVEAGVEEGAEVAFQSAAEPPLEGGCYVPFVLFDRVSPHQKIAREEIFGPVLSVLSFSSDEDALSIANDTIYGLSAIVWTRDLSRAHRAVFGLDVGWTVVNASESPRGGVGIGALAIGGHKQSGIGVEGGIEGLEDYVSKTAVQIHA